MKINLRQANALQEALKKQIPQVSQLKLFANLSQYEDPFPIIEKTKNSLIDNIRKSSKILLAITEIRSKIGKANSDSGISSILTNLNGLDSAINLFGKLTSAEVIKSNDYILNRIEKLKTKSDSFNQDTLISTGLFTEEEIENFKSELKLLQKNKQFAKDELLKLNITTEIQLSEETISLLEELELI